MDAIKSIRDWCDKRLDLRRMKRFGGIQTCTWCGQTANQNDSWSITVWERDPFLDVLKCGVCGGTSLWRFEMGMIFIGPLSPPESSHTAAEYYDIEAAKLIGAEIPEGPNITDHVPWSGLKIRFKIDDYGIFRQWIDSHGHSGRDIPAGWSFVEDFSTDTPDYAMFLVDGPFRTEDANHIASLLAPFQDGEAPNG